MIQECKFAYDTEVGDCTELKEFPALQLMTSITLRIITRFIAGKELSRDQTFLNDTSSYFDGNFLTGFIMLKLPFGNRVREILAWPLYKYHQHFRQQRLIDRIKPIIARRMKESKAVHENAKSPEYDAVRTLLELLAQFPLDDKAAQDPLHTLSHEILQLLWAAGQSPAISITAVLFELLEKQEYLPVLQCEAEEAVAKCGWTHQALNELPIMDSFIRETHRVHPSFVRK